MDTSDFYKPIHVENLNEIQQEVLKLIPKNLLDQTTLTYIENSKEIFLSIPTLYDFLKSKKMHWSVGDIAINITQGNDAGNFHMDSGPYKHSLNIPIIGCENTWINFFKVNSDYKVATVENKGKTHHFYRYTEDQCELIYEAETSNPYLLGVKTPHRVINKSNQTRIMLLLRLYPGPWLNS
jgi:hypothetical protein